MRATGVIKLDPVSEDTARMLEGFKAMPMHALLFDRANDALDQAVLFWCIRLDKLLLQAVATHERGVVPAAEDEAIVRPEQKRRGDTPERAESGDEGLFQRIPCGGRFPASREMPAQQFARVAIDHQRERRPAIPPCPDATEIGRPPRIGFLVP